MSGIRAIAQTVEVSIGGAGEETKTILQIKAGSNHRLLVEEFSISFNGVSNTQKPILCEITRQDNAGTMSPLTPKKIDKDASETLQASALHTATVEPSSDGVLIREEIHPQGGFTWQAPYAKEIIVKGGGRLGIVLFTASGVVVDAVARFGFEE